MALNTKTNNVPNIKVLRRSEESLQKSQNIKSSGLMDSILCQMDEIHAPSVVDIQPTYSNTSEALYLNYQTLERNHRYWSRQKPTFDKDIDLMTRLIWYKSMRGRVDAYARMSITHKEEFFSSLSGDWMDPLDKEKYGECLNKHGKGPRTPPGSPCTSIGGGVIPTDTSPTSEGLTKIYDSVGSNSYYDDKNVLLNELAASTKVSVSEVEKAIGKDLEDVIKGVNKETLLATLKSALLNLSSVASKETSNKISDGDEVKNELSSDEMSLVSSSDDNSTVVSILPPPPPPEDILLLANKMIESPPEPPKFNLEVKYPMSSSNNSFANIDSTIQPGNNIYSGTPSMHRSQELFPILNLPCTTPPPSTNNPNFLYRNNDQSSHFNSNKRYFQQTPNTVNPNLKRKYDKSPIFRNNKYYNSKNVNNISTPVIPAKYKCVQSTTPKNISNTMNYNNSNNSTPQPRRIPTVDLTGSSSTAPGVQSPTGMMQQNTLRMIPPPPNMQQLGGNNMSSGLGMLPNIITMNQNPFGPGKSLPTNGSSMYGPPVGMNNNTNFIKSIKPNNSNNPNFGPSLRFPPPPHSIPPSMMSSTLGTNFWK
uniref:Bromodomain-containing protein n=1 Tax=Strongyloides venezuelensis TaxID=75913 RepID=A0A0K0G1U1_STRVS